MTIFTTEQRYGHLKSWVTSGQLLKDYCNEAGVSESAMRRWSMNILGSDYTSTLRSREQKAALLKKIEKRETSALCKDGGKAHSGALVKVSGSRQMAEAVAAPISIEYMGAKISIDERSVESVFRALKAVNG